MPIHAKDTRLIISSMCKQLSSENKLVKLSPCTIQISLYFYCVWDQYMKLHLPVGLDIVNCSHIPSYCNEMNIQYSPASRLAQK